MTRKYKRPRPGSQPKIKSKKKDAEFVVGKRRPVPTESKSKTKVTIRLDDDLLKWFRRQEHEDGGTGYETLINIALRHYVQEKSPGSGEES